MDLRIKVWLFAFLTILLFTSTELVAQCTAADGDKAEELEVLPFDYKVPISTFENVISLFQSDVGKQVNTEIGGFVFIPVRMAQPPGSSPQGRDTVPFISEGMRIYLTYYVYADDTIRSIAMYRYDANAMTPCVDVPQNKPGVITLPVMDGNNQLGFTPVGRMEPFEEAAFKEAPPMDLSYLSYDDYLYLKSNSFYPLATDTGNRKEATHIIIRRAMADQMFNLANPDNYGMEKYRTLSFQPYPFAGLGPNQEAVMAFKYGYYCPPYWTGDPPVEDTAARSPQLRQQVVIDINEKEFEGSMDFPSNPIVSIPTQEDINKVLGGFIESQIITRDVIEEDIAKKASFWKKNGLIISVIIALILGFILGFILGRRTINQQVNQE